MKKIYINKNSIAHNRENEKKRPVIKVEYEDGSITEHFNLDIHENGSIKLSLVYDVEETNAQKTSLVMTTNLDISEPTR